MLTLQTRIRELLYGILAGSLAGAFVPIGLAWAGYPWTSATQRISAATIGHRAPILVALLSILALILPRFFHKSLGLLRSWRSGMVRGVSLVWAISTFFYWMERHHLCFLIVVGAIFEILTELVQAYRPVHRFTNQEIGAWLPRSRVQQGYTRTRCFPSLRGFFLG